MSIDIFQRLAFQLSRLSVFIALALGFIVSLIQVAQDFQDQKQLYTQKVQEIFAVTRQSAQQTVYLLDTTFAQEIITGLQNYPFLSAASLTDDRLNVMASFSQTVFKSQTSRLTETLIGSTSDHVLPLENDENYVEGTLKLTVDNNFAYQDFYSRAGYIFLSGFARNFALAFILLWAFHWFMTKDLVQVARKVSDINPNKPEGHKIELPKRHRSNELGHIVEAINGFISSSEENLASLKQARDQLSVVIDTVPNLIFAVDEKGRFLFANNATCIFFNMERSALLESNFFALEQKVNPVEAERIQEETLKVLATFNAHENKDSITTDASGRLRHFQVNRIPFDHFGDACVLQIAVDISERVEAEQQIRKMAYFDALTELPNRNLLVDRLEMDILRSKRQQHFGALMFVDLDNFKVINDTAGHSAGDEVIAKIAKNMSSKKRSTDTLARLGGDEFALSLPDLSENLEEAKQQAMHIAQGYIEILDHRFELQNQTFTVSASIGIVIYPSVGETHSELLRFADTAMYRAKRLGKNQACLFEKSMVEEVQEQVDLETDVRRGITSDEFVIHVQPIYASDGQTIRSAEALIRWHHPKEGLLPPARFIDFFESLKISGQLTRVCFTQCCLLAKKLNIDTLLKDGFKFAINISSQEFYEEQFEQEILNILEVHGIPAQLFEIEITESVTLSDIATAERKIRNLREKGFSFALDDFGTGYSSLSYLKRLTVDKLKIDRAFIQDIQVDKQDQHLVESIVDIAHNFGLKIVAEGVETDEQRQWLTQFDHMLMQGYFFNRPMPTEDFTRLMSDQ